MYPSIHSNSPKIGIIDVGLGNIPALLNSFFRIGISAATVSSEKQLLHFTKLVLPGVGSMHSFMSRLRSLHLDSAIRAFAGYGHIYGICLGFQSLFSYSEEGHTDCLNIFPGTIRPFSAATNLCFNVGYSTISPPANCNALRLHIPLSAAGITSLPILPSHPEYYFTHGYYLDAFDGEHATSFTRTGFSFIACIQDENVYGSQFHPELSHLSGRLILNNFALL